MLQCLSFTMSNIRALNSESHMDLRADEILFRIIVRCCVATTRAILMRRFGSQREWARDSRVILPFLKKLRRWCNQNSQVTNGISPHNYWPYVLCTLLSNHIPVYHLGMHILLNHNSGTACIAL